MSNLRTIMSRAEARVWIDKHWPNRLPPWQASDLNVAADMKWKVIDPEGMTWYTDGWSGVIWKFDEPNIGPIPIQSSGRCTCGGQKFGGGTCSSWCDLNKGNNI